MCFTNSKQKGYIEKEIEKETDIVMAEPDECSEAPKPKDMIALEVIKNSLHNKTNIFVNFLNTNLIINFPKEKNHGYS